jgi:hypothetical protein
LLGEPGKFDQRVAKVLEWLTYDSGSNQIEEAICELGKLLGLDAERPDNTPSGPARRPTGPDAIWLAAARNEGASFEAKTGKQKTSKYSKDDIGQCHDHAQWLLTNKPGVTFSEFIVGRHLAVTPEANPALELRVIELEELVKLAQRLQTVSKVVLRSSPDQRANVAHAMFKAEGMLWPNVVDRMPSRYALDLQSNPPAPDDAD